MQTVTARDTNAEDEEKEEVEGSSITATQEETEEVPRTSREYHDTTALPFPERRRRPVADEQFSKFVEVIKKLYVNIPLLDAMQVPMYAKYLKDILGNKRCLLTTEVVQLTEEYSAAIVDPLPEKKKGTGCPTITCSIGAQHFKHALCDLRASVGVMPKVVYDKLNHHALAPTIRCLQLADQSVRYPAGITENILVKIRNFFIPIDFVVLDMEVDTKTPLILGRLFLSTANAHIDVGVGEIQLNINGQKEKFAFRPKAEQCSQVKTFNRKKSEKEPDKQSTPSIKALIEFVENLRI
ncbi:hypothetical protein GQ55_9G306000 [Panicum hallii var. hallii]|uniref:Aspartic peptidase DDI1-type domain-containing protein n=1 Tax=Panicum hallii var. hallii TaxID=1504633 RepID=A0A2T7C7W3_9POAL|nr:hypothetical protein GQ55_9G306000 [Panicum hallii var. hallii]